MRAAALCLFASAAAAAPAAAGWSVRQFRNLVTFGDSYTDENRLNYFGSHAGAAPPPGTLLPESLSTAGGGRTWARYVVQYTGHDAGGKWDPALTLYNYAVSGAVCSNQLTPRTFGTINAPFPDVVYETDAFAADSHSERNGTNQPYFQPPRTAANSVYSMWIGTNDVGVYAFLTDSQVPGKTLADYSDCVFGQFDKLYRDGARYFVLMNLVPLDLAPLYANASAGGLAVSHYWPDKPSNLTAIAQKMGEYVATANQVMLYRTPYEAALVHRYPGAKFALFDTHALISDIYNHPTAYLNGSAPANVTSFARQCSADGSTCTVSPSPDSFLWYDELHPSEQTDRVVAREFVRLLGGSSKYARYWG